MDSVANQPGDMRDRTTAQDLVSSVLENDRDRLVVERKAQHRKTTSGAAGAEEDASHQSDLIMRPWRRLWSSVGDHFAHLVQDDERRRARTTARTGGRHAFRVEAESAAPVSLARAVATLDEAADRP
jgi:hypothetical protein